jgi:competence protein ComEA
MKRPLRILLAGAIAIASAVAARAADAPEAAAAGKKVNINQATSAQLALLPRVGAKAAERIVEYRKEHGTFSAPEQLMEIKGVGEKLFTVLKPYVALSGPTTLTAKVRSGFSGRRAGSRKASNSVPVGKGR